MAGATFDAPGGRALDASLAGIGGDLDASSDFSSRGRLVLEGARVEGSVHLDGATVDCPLSVRNLRAASIRTDTATELQPGGLQPPAFQPRSGGTPPAGLELNRRTHENLCWRE